MDVSADEAPETGSGSVVPIQSNPAPVNSTPVRKRVRFQLPDIDETVLPSEEVSSSPRTSPYPGTECPRPQRNRPPRKRYIPAKFKDYELVQTMELRMPNY